MLLRLPRYLSIFFVILLLNLIVMVKAYRYSLKNTKILVILEEIKTLDKFPRSNSNVLGAESDDITKDGRVANLKSFFREHNSPLYEYADVIVQVSDKYGLDFKLLPAIAMQESNVCRVIPDNSYNCWGWGIYGNTITRFSSYPEAIDTVAHGLKDNYIDKGLVTPDEIMMKYNPSSPNGSWANGVNTFLKVLE